MKRSALFRFAVVAMFLYVAGCSGLSPQKPDDPPDPNLGCGGTISVYSPLSGGLGPVGTDTTLDLATWNLEFFPVTTGGFDCPDPINPARVQKVAELVNTLNLDVIAVEEISSPEGFQQLLDLCPAYGGAIIAESHGCNYQRTGVIYRKDIATLHSSRTLNELSVFTREPFEADLTVAQSGKSYRFKLIVVHLKAGGEADAPRRRQETTALHAYLDAKSVSEPDVDYIVAGDWNDVLTDPALSTSFPAFLADTADYSFVTDPLKSRGDMASLGGRLIDLILVNRTACPDFAGARVSTLSLDLLDRSYSSLVSDHRPVMVSAPIFK